MNGQGAAENWDAMDMRAPAAQQFSNPTIASHQPIRRGPLVNGAPIPQSAGNVSERPRPVTNVLSYVDWPSIATGASNQNSTSDNFQRPRNEPPRKPQSPVTSQKSPRPGHHVPRSVPPTMSVGTAAKCREMWCRLQVVLDGKPIVAQDELQKFRSELERLRQQNNQQIASKDEEIARLTDELQNKESENQFCRERLNNELKSLHDRMQEKEHALDDLEQIAVDIKNLQDENVQLKEQVEELTDEATALDSTWKAKIDAVEAEKAKLKNKLKSKEKQLELELTEHGQSENNLNDKMSEMKSRLSFLKFQTIVLRSDKKRKREEIAKLKNSLTLAEEKCSESVRNSEKLSEELVEEKKLCKKAMEDEAYSQKLATELRSQLKERLAAKPSSSKEPSPDRIKELEVKNKKLKLRVAYFETKLGEMNVLKNKLREKDSRLGHMEKDAVDTERRLRKKCLELEKEFQSLRAENHKLKSGVETKTMTTQTTLDLDKLQSQLDSEKKRAEDLKRSLEDSQNQVKLWREQLSSLECRIFEIEKDNAPLRMEVTKQKSRIVELEPMEERAKKLEDDKKRLIDQIKSHENGVLCLTKETHSAKRERQAMENRLSDVKSKYERQLSATKESYQRQLSENVNLHKTINENLKEIDHLRSTVTTVRKTVSAVVQERDELKEKVKAVSDAKTAIFKKQSEDSKKLDELNETLKVIASDGEKWKKMTETLTEEKRIMTAVNSGLSEQLGKSQVEVEKIAKDRTNWKNLADLLTTEKKNMTKKHNEDIDNLKKDLEEANRERKELDSRLLALSIEKSAVDKQLENEQKNRIDSKTVKELEKTVQDLKKKISQLEDDKNDIKRTKAKLSDELSDLSGIRDNALRNINRLEKDLEEKKATIRSLSGRVRELERDRSRERDSRRIDRERRHGHPDRDLRDVLEQPSLMDDRWNNGPNNSMNMRNISPIFFDGPPLQLSPSMPFDSGPRLRDIDMVFNSNMSPEMPFDVPRDMGLRDMDPRDMGPRDMDPRDMGPRDIDPRDMDPRDLVPRAMDPRDIDPRDTDPRDWPRDNGPSWRESRRPRRGRERRGPGKGLKCRSCPGYFPNKFELKNHHCDDFR